MLLSNLYSQRITLAALLRIECTGTRLGARRLVSRPLYEGDCSRGGEKEFVLFFPD